MVVLDFRTPWRMVFTSLRNCRTSPRSVLIAGRTDFRSAIVVAPSTSDLIVPRSVTMVAMSPSIVVFCAADSFVLASTNAEPS